MNALAVSQEELPSTAGSPPDEQRRRCSKRYEALGVIAGLCSEMSKVSALAGRQRRRCRHELTPRT
jgi:hypothetical protein